MLELNRLEPNRPHARTPVWSMQNHPSPPALGFDEPTLCEIPAWAEEPRDTERLPIRVAIRTTVLDDRLLVVRILDSEAPLPPGMIEAELRLSR